jgi:hypothetical protein
MRFNKACLDCGTLSPNGYCDNCRRRREQARTADPIRKAHKAEMYGSRYRKLARALKATATTCHLCGQGYRPDDPWEADHLYPEMGADSPLAPAHRSCNQSRGNKPIN